VAKTRNRGRANLVDKPAGKSQIVIAPTEMSEVRHEAVGTFGHNVSEAVNIAL